MSNIPWFSPVVGQSEKHAVLEVMDSNYLNDGDVTRTFEQRLADIIGVKHCVAVSSGTAAIALALMGLGIGKDDEVIVPDLTFIATANAVRLTGADVKLVDVEPGRFTLDPQRVVEAIGPRTRAIAPVDVNGRGADYDSLGAICREHGLFSVCDATEALGSRHGGKMLGSFGDAGCFSFSANKTVTCGQGGMVATNHTHLYHRLLELKDQGRRQQGTGGNDLHPTMGFNFKLTNLQAAVGLAQLERLDERLAQARTRDSWYRELLADCPGVDVSRLGGQNEGCLQWADALFDDRPRIERTLGQASIGFRPFWNPIHTQRPYANADGQYPNTTFISDRGLWLPSHFGLTEGQVERVCATIREAALSRSAT